MHMHTCMTDYKKMHWHVEAMAIIGQLTHYTQGQTYSSATSYKDRAYCTLQLYAPDALRNMHRARQFGNAFMNIMAISLNPYVSVLPLLASMIFKDQCRAMCA